MELIHSLLLQAIEGETGAEACYKKYSQKALAEGLPGIASLFESLSRAEAIHIANHRRALEKNGYTATLPTFAATCDVGTTTMNLQQAISAEYEEFKDMYPSFRRQIQKKYRGSFEAKIALLSIKWASESEANHHGLLQKALKIYQSAGDISGGDYYLCSVCGNIHYRPSAPCELCEVCGHDISFYTKVRVGQ